MNFWILTAEVWRSFRDFWRIPTAEERAFIDPDARCGCCGAMRGTLRTVTMLKPGLLRDGEQRERVLRVRRTCSYCGAAVHHKPLAMSVNLENTLPAAPRNEIERADDLRTTFQQST